MAVLDIAKGECFINFKIGEILARLRPEFTQPVKFILHRNIIHGIYLRKEAVTASGNNNKEGKEITFHCDVLGYIKSN
ncbi:hypothetical protein CKK33_13840 [Mucilaginibacter sp. MD40]|nr:hypothetical protein CKK33_13840 [Mucilaginibacter sp. MD40]